jgi:DNA cross-link repair 1C protein
MSTFNGEIIEIPGVCVDRFDNDKFKIYFLSHCHFDHLQGLEKEPKFPIYCSELSSHFLKQRYPHCSDHIKIVSIGSPMIIQENDLSFQVTLIPAGHCAGSCKT